MQQVIYFSIGNALHHVSPDINDTRGYPLFNKERLLKIWETLRKHLRCLQDPQGVSLYTVTGQMLVGGIWLNCYSCARGSVSLESAHKYIAEFVPGKSLISVFLILNDLYSL